MSKPTIREVAARAEVSVSVASNALNDKGRVSAATRARVRQAAAELGYTPSYPARRLRGGQTRAIGAAIGAAIGTVFTVPAQARTSPGYFSAATQTFGRAAAEAGYKLHYIHLTDPTIAAEALREVLSDGAIDGALFIAPPLGLIERINAAMGSLPHIPYILFSAASADPGVSYVDSDGYSGLYAATQQLLRQGHTRIAHLTHAGDDSNAADRRRGYEAAMRAAGLPPRCYTLAYSAEALPIEALLRDGVTALLAFDDLLALRCINALQQQGKQIPQDMAVIGFNNEPFTALTTPALSTLEQPLAEMGAAAIAHLTRAIEGQTTEPYRQSFPVAFIPRASSEALQSKPLLH